MEELKSRVAMRVGGVLLAEDVRMVGVDASVAPVYVNPRRGTTKYPFERLEVGHSMEVRRKVGTMRSAVRQWLRHHKGQRFQVWRMGDGWTKVKRVR
jgi:hypothetical protein